MESDSVVYRTVAVKLDLQPANRRRLFETIEQYRWAANYVVSAVWPDSEDRPDSTGRNELHHRTYDSIRKETDLHSSQVGLARDRAIEAMRSVIEQRKKGVQTGKPDFSSDFLDFNSKCATISDTHASLATVDGRVHADFIIPSEPSSPHQQYLLTPEFEPARSTLIVKDGSLFLHIALERQNEVPEFEPEHPAILGVDLGISNGAVSSTGRFWNVDELTHWRDEYDQRRCSLQ
jgi:transposase